MINDNDGNVMAQFGNEEDKDLLYPKPYSDWASLTEQGKFQIYQDVPIWCKDTQIPTKAPSFRKSF